MTDNLGSETKKATGLPLFQAIGQSGAVLGSHMYPLTQGPRYVWVALRRACIHHRLTRLRSGGYRKGFAVNCALDLLAAVVAVVLTVCRIPSDPLLLARLMCHTCHDMLAVDLLPARQ